MVSVLKILLHLKKGYQELICIAFQGTSDNKLRFFQAKIRLSLKAIMKKRAGRPIEYVKSKTQKSACWVLFNVFWSDLRKMVPWK